jgi:hypothetical protein
VEQRRSRRKSSTLLSSTLQGVVQQMGERLSRGNVESALSAVVGTARDRYRELFLALLANDPAAVNQFGSVLGGQVSESSCELVIGRQESTGIAGHMLYLIRGVDGIWRIDSM